jgi:hypothetical protein
MVSSDHEPSNDLWKIEETRFTMGNWVVIGGIEPTQRCDHDLTAFRHKSSARQYEPELRIITICCEANGLSAGPPT